MGHGPVAVQAHGGEGEDGGVHGEQVQAQEEATAGLPERPVGRQAVVHDEGSREEVEEVSQG